jgi:diacylglycerol kinase (ATP)
MSIPYAKVIVNPVAGGFYARKQWPQINKQLHNVGLSFDCEFTKGTGHATELARQASDVGYRCIVVIGGDGTVNEVANGILCSTHSDSTILGIVSAGSACTFARSLGIPRDCASACSLLIGQGRALIDVGVVECQSNGQPIQRYFVNTADVGLGSAIVDAWKRLPNHLGRSVIYSLRTIEGLSSLIAHRNKLITLHIGDEVLTICSCDVIIANGQYFADGMQMAPHASLEDGLLDVLTVGDIGRYELLKLWPKLYSGGHIGHSKIRECKTTRVAIESDEPLFVEADGLIVGETPASFRVIPSALTVVV